MPLGVQSLTWWYHMFGSAMGTLRLDARDAGGAWRTLWSRTGQQQRRQNDTWRFGQVQLPRGLTNVTFVGVAGGHTSDMAIDSIVWSSTFAPTHTPTSPTHAPTSTPTTGTPTTFPTSACTNKNSTAQNVGYATSSHLKERLCCSLKNFNGKRSIAEQGPSRIFCVLNQILRAKPRSHCRGPLRLPLPALALQNHHC